MGPRRRWVAWTEGAHRELDEAISYVAQDSPQNAATLLDRLLRAAESLAELSERGRVLPELLGCCTDAVTLIAGVDRI